jgi:hypothetical protein
MALRSKLHYVLWFYGLRTGGSINWERIVFVGSTMIFITAAALYAFGLVP